MWSRGPAWGGTTPGTKVSGLYLLAIREAAGGFVGTVGCMVKPPHHGYSVWRDRSGRFHHREEKLALKRHHYLFTHPLPYDYSDLTLSGGAGVAVLRTARAAADRPFHRSIDNHDSLLNPSSEQLESIGNYRIQLDL